MSTAETKPVLTLLCSRCHVYFRRSMWSCWRADFRRCRDCRQPTKPRGGNRAPIFAYGGTQ